MRVEVDIFSGRPSPFWTASPQGRGERQAAGIAAAKVVLHPSRQDEPAASPC